MTKQTAAQGYILKLTSERSEIFIAHDRDYFAEPVLDFYHKKGSPLIVFISTDGISISHIASGRAGYRAGTGMRRLNLSKIEFRAKKLLFEKILEHVPGKVRDHIRKRFEQGGILPVESFKALVSVMIELDPTLHDLLGRFSEVRERRIMQLSSKSVAALAMQKEAIKSALYLADMDRDPLLEWSPKGDAEQKSFLDGLPSSYLREDQMIFNDLTQIPGFEMINKRANCVATFVDENVRLDVILANRMPLEEQTGADLIYYNATYSSFVLVQYKAMEQDYDEEDIPLYRIPNAKLSEEISRMDELFEILQTADSDAHRGSYRLNSNPFFIKLCYRILLDPDSVALTKGMYLSLDHWKVIEKDNDPSLLGLRGGKRITSQNVGRYLNNEEFSNLIKGAWVGTTPTQSSILEKIVTSLLQGDKAVILAIKSQHRQSVYTMTVKDEDNHFDIDSLF